jgi:leucyl-tRNA synthetase
MSKSRGNVVAPDDQVARWGADTFRAYLMFLGPWDQGGPYDVDGIVGVYRWLSRVWAAITDPPTLVEGHPGARELQIAAHSTLMKVGEDYEAKRFNTAIAAMMELTNTLQRARDAGEADRDAWGEAVRLLILMLAPACPHVSEELWARTGGGYSVHQQGWPAYTPALTVRDVVEIAVQVNGKVRARIEVAPDASEDAAREVAFAQPNVAEQVEGRSVVKVIYVPGRLLNVVVK